jgi:hypothetical protein
LGVFITDLQGAWPVVSLAAEAPHRYDIEERGALRVRRQIARLLECRMHVARDIGIDGNASECAHAPYDRTQP